MSDQGPDGITLYEVDRDEFNVGYERLTIRYHNGATSPVTWDNCPTILGRGDYIDFRGATANQSSFDTTATNKLGGWYTSKPTGYKVALRNSFLVDLPR